MSMKTPKNKPTQTQNQKTPVSKQEDRNTSRPMLKTTKSFRISGYTTKWSQLDKIVKVVTKGDVDGQPISFDNSLDIDVSGLTREQIQSLVIGLKIGTMLAHGRSVPPSLLDSVSKLRKPLDTKDSLISEDLYEGDKTKTPSVETEGTV